jgi:peptidoglycan-N-acetylglucosamine deacetylase
MERIQMIDNPMQWPDGKKCAVAITFDMDSDSILHLDHPQRADTMVSTASMLRYDRIAIPRILKLYERFGIRQTFFIPGWCAEQYPDTVRAIAEAGHEIGHHGYLHEHPNSLSSRDEEYWFMRGLDALERIVGKRPVGFRAPMYNFSKHSATYLKREGFLYDTSLQGDDLPYLLSCAEGDLVEIPTDWAADDWPHYMHSPDFNYLMSIKSPDQAMEVYLSLFEAARRYGTLWVSVWHPFVSGRLARLMRIEEMLEYMTGQGDVWFATLEDIARHVQGEIDSGRFTPRREAVPFYDGQILELH